MFYGCWSAPRSARKNTACLVTYLIATGHHLCLGFPLLVFWAQTRLISWLALIRGHISEHSRVSHAACWEKWNAINQSGFLFNVLDSGNKRNADWVSDAETKFARCAEKYGNQWSIADMPLFPSSLRSTGVRNIFVCCIRLDLYAFKLISWLKAISWYLECYPEQKNKQTFEAIKETYFTLLPLNCLRRVGRSLGSSYVEWGQWAAGTWRDSSSIKRAESLRGPLCAFKYDNSTIGTI